MTFDDIVGQENSIKSIRNTLRSNRTAHAYLFYGPDGVGKSLAASMMAAALNCKNSRVDPCGRCPSCIKSADGNHPDVIHIHPGKKKSDRLSISVEDIRSLQEDMQKRPYEDGVKIYIIHESSRMTEQAQNALLKILEEPPSYTVIILLSSSRDNLLKTILSRCQLVRFSRAPEKDIEDYLVKKQGIERKYARYVAAFSDGILGRALNFLNDGELKKLRDEVLGISASMHNIDKLQALSYVDYFINNKDRIESILDIMLCFFRDIVIYKECGDSRYIMNPDRIDEITDCCAWYTLNNLMNIIMSIKYEYECLKSNANFQLSIENMLLSIQEG